MERTLDTESLDTNSSKVGSGCSQVSGLTSDDGVSCVGSSVASSEESRTGDRENRWKKPVRRTVHAVGAAATFGGIVLGCGKIGLVLSPVTLGVMWALRDKKPSKEADLVLGVVNGDIEVEKEATLASTCEGEQQPRKIVGGGRNDAEVVKTKKKQRWYQLKKQPKRRIPVLAGEVASGLKVRHGLLADNAENRRLIRSDASRRCEALRRDGDEWFKNLRNHDMLAVVVHASQMFWLMSDDEEAAISIYDDHYLVANRRRRAKLASSPTAC
ncbi:hypothetical protein 1 [Wenzhou tombus-like virus 9]|uniref:hypothetical protein 1 n=1 Tax=Wenzhou tombus-like virus 9 TaxID=1923679 RepID=UPI000909F212|nr:hypothetical protein 1 [Wenzhou tombus-like virus 9]APG76645.1 hypothetical protein 1 [Wenzhou tombus-like virus 9]